MSDQVPASLPPEFPVHCFFVRFDDQRNVQDVGALRIEPMSLGRWGFALSFQAPSVIPGVGIGNVEMLVPFTRDMIRAGLRELSVEDRLEMARRLGLDDDEIKALIRG